MLNLDMLSGFRPTIDAVNRTNLNERNDAQCFNMMLFACQQAYRRPRNEEPTREDMEALLVRELMILDSYLDMSFAPLTRKEQAAVDLRRAMLCYELTTMECNEELTD